MLGWPEGSWTSLYFPKLIFLNSGGGGVMAVRLPADHWGTRAISCYEKVEQIGEGTYGQVIL